MSGYKHWTLYTFGNIVFHKITRTRGMITGIQLTPDSKARYGVVFEDNIEETVCHEMELSTEPQDGVTA